MKNIPELEIFEILNTQSIEVKCASRLGRCTWMSRENPITVKAKKKTNKNKQTNEVVLRYHSLNYLISLRYLHGLSH